MIMQSLWAPTPALRAGCPPRGLGWLGAEAGPSKPSGLATPAEGRGLCAEAARRQPGGAP